MITPARNCWTKLEGDFVLGKFSLQNFFGLTTLQI